MTILITFLIDSIFIPREKIRWKIIWRHNYLLFNHLAYLFSEESMFFVWTATSKCVICHGPSRDHQLKAILDDADDVDIWCQFLPICRKTSLTSSPSSPSFTSEAKDLLSFCHPPFFLGLDHLPVDLQDLELLPNGRDLPASFILSYPNKNSIAGKGSA